MSSTHRPDPQHGGRAASGTAQQGAHAGQEFLHGKGLGQIVIGAGIDAFHPLSPGAPCGQDQHREVAPSCPPFLQHGQPVELWETEVQQSDVVLLGVAPEPGVFAVGDRIDGIAGGVEGDLHLPGNAGVVLHQQDAHQWSSRLMILAVAASTWTSVSWPAGAMTRNS